MGHMDEKTTVSLIFMAGLLLGMSSVADAGELTLVQHRADVAVSDAGLKLTAGRRNGFSHEGRRVDVGDITRLIESLETTPTYIYISGDDLSMHHLLELARLGQRLGFRTLYHQKGVLKVISLE